VVVVALQCPLEQGLPESWAGAKLFKTIGLLPGRVRTALGDAMAILEAIDKDGYADLGTLRGA
jgi:hypothetical protein